MHRRARLLARVRRSIERTSHPRWQLSLILGFTGLIGFLVSLGLLRLGLDHMGWRYATAFLAAYACFLAMLRLWAHTYRSGSDPGDALDVDLGPGADGAPDGMEGGGGTFGGGGASGSWDDGFAGAASDADSVGADAVGSALSADLDEGWLLLLPLALLLSGLVAVAFVIYSAPLLLAELVLDIVILGGVYRRLRGVEPESWLWNALRRTWLPALVLCLLLVGLGFAMQAATPEARSIGEALAAG